MIKQEAGKYVLYAKDGKKKLGTFGSKKEAEDRERQVNYFKHAKAEVILTITKASIQDGVMRWQAVASDTEEDRTGEKTSLVLFRDWIERVETGKSAAFLPAPRRPFLGLSHYPDLDGFGEAGPTEQMYIDNKCFKVAGTFYGDDTHPLGKALFEAVRRERELTQRGEAVTEPIRISAAWWDLCHSHGDFVFERKSLTDVCPMCAQGAGDKTYLKGQLDHFAATRVPINPRTSLALEEKAMVKRVEDAASIVDPELAKELEKRAKLVGKSETEEEPAGLVIKADEEPAIEKMEDDEEPEEYRPFGGATSLEEAEAYMASQQMMGQAYSNWGMFQEVMRNILERSEPGEMKAKMQTAISEFGDRIGALKSAIEDAYLIQDGAGGEVMPAQENKSTFGAAIESLEAAIATEGSREAKFQAVQAAFNQLAEVVKAEIDAVAPPDPNAEINKAILEQLQLLNAKMAGPAAQPMQPPQQKSFVPTGQTMKAATELPISPITGQPSTITAAVNRTTRIKQ